MSYIEWLIYLFGFCSILSALLMIGSWNPVHAIFFLILVFCFVSGLLLILNVEFLAIIFIVVYVGAIAVLFLFVVMMLNIRLVELWESLMKYLPIGLILGFIFVWEFYTIFQKNLWVGDLKDFYLWVEGLNSVSNLENLGLVLYTYFVYYFMIAGVVLLLAMVGTIVLTLYHNVNVKRQEVYKQVGRDYNITVQGQVLEKKTR